VTIYKPHAVSRYQSEPPEGYHRQFLGVVSIEPYGSQCFYAFILAQSLAMLLFHDKWFCSIVDADFYVVACIGNNPFAHQIVMVAGIQRRLIRFERFQQFCQCMPRQTSGYLA
jgi:hypothetical protein